MRQLSEDWKPEGRERKGFAPYADPAEFEVTVQKHTSILYNIYLFGAIEEAGQFVSALEALSRATEDDMVVIHLSTGGGSLDAADTFLHAMRKCAARVHVDATGGVHSAGTLILLNADSFHLSDNFNCLIHNGSCGSGGDYNKFKSHAFATMQYMEKVMRKTYEGFLSEDEIDNLIAGQDLWLDAEGFCKRYEQRNEWRGKRGEVEEAVHASFSLEEEEEQPVKKPAPKRRPKKA